MRGRAKLITKEVEDYVAKNLSYSPETGEFRWLTNWGVRHSAGDLAGRLSDAGYLIISVNQIPVKLHWIAWWISFGEWPDFIVDHKNTIKTDNRIENLRRATHSQNKMNSPAHKDSVSGIKGIHWRKDKRLWRATIMKDGQKYYLGAYKDKMDAARAYDEACIRLHGEFARPNNIPSPVAT